MRVAVQFAPSSHFTGLMGAMAAGIERAGDTVEKFFVGQRPPEHAEAIVVWGWRRGKLMRRLNLPVLVMERGYVGDRFYWTSVGWNGLNRRAIFPKPREALVGYRRLAIGLGSIPEWRVNPEGYALILGQVQSDQACVNVNLAYQYRAWSAFLGRAGYAVRFRQHPKALRQHTGITPRCYTRGSLAEDLAGAKFTVSWNSNASVDSVLAGVPSVTFDEGAMAWDVTSHDLANPVTMPSRTDWAARLAWCQWQPPELSDGTAWKAVREVKP